MANPTTNFGWDLPIVGGSVNTWGTILNTLAQDIDDDLQLVKTTADAAMPKAGGIFTGDVEYAAGARLIEDDTIMAALEADWALGNFFSKGLSSGNNTITFTNYPTSGKVQFITLELRQPSGGDGTVTWPAAVDWQDGIAPTLSATSLGKDILVFYTRDGGTNVIGAHSISEPS
jgi:hypothetical protein